MSFVYPNVLSNEELHYLNHHPEVLVAKSTLDSQASGMVYFSIPMTDQIRTTLQDQFNLDLSHHSTIPMRWIKGDTEPHVDIGKTAFMNTYLLYLTDSPGELIIDSHSYPIQSNTGFVFNEGLPHETLSTERVARLLIGPMNEFIEPVGAAPTPPPPSSTSNYVQGNLDTINNAYNLLISGAPSGYSSSSINIGGDTSTTYGVKIQSDATHNAFIDVRGDASNKLSFRHKDNGSGTISSMLELMNDSSLTGTGYGAIVNGRINASSYYVGKVDTRAPTNTGVYMGTDGNVGYFNINKGSGIGGFEFKTYNADGSLLQSNLNLTGSGVVQASYYTASGNANDFESVAIMGFDASGNIVRHYSSNLRFRSIESRLTSSEADVNGPVLSKVNEIIDRLNGLSFFSQSISTLSLSVGEPENPPVNSDPDTAITVITTASSGASLVLNLDSRNTNSLARGANPGTWNDLSSNHNNATIYGAVAYGLKGGQYCAVFPGAQTDYVQALDGAYFTGTSFTVQSWVYVTTVLNWNRIFDFGNGAGSNNVLLANSYGVTGKPGIYIEGSQFQSTLAGSNTVLLNAWHQICCTFNYVSGPNGIATIYVDGQPAGAGTLPKPVNIVRNKCYIGRSNWGFGDPNMNGGIGSLQIYNGLLSDAEILSNYNTTKSYYGL